MMAWFPALFSLSSLILPGVRTGREHCWVKYASFANTAVCVPREVWREGLAGDDSGGGAKERLRPRTFPRNSALDPPKKVRWEATTRTAPELAPWLLALERERERISSLLSPSDRLGAFRRLIVDERLPGGQAGELRTLGFVHVFTTSGIHLYALAGTVHAVFEGACRWGGLPVRWGLRGARFAAALTWLWAWALCGLRPGLLRPLVVVGLRAGAQTAGLRWRSFAPLGIALAMDVIVALIQQDWAPGRWHYAAAVGGGLWALERVRDRGPLIQHFAMALGSWLATVPLEILHTSLVSLATPALSLLTVPLLATFAYPVVFLGTQLGLPTQALVEFCTAALESLVAIEREWPGWVWELSPIAGAFGLALAALLHGQSKRTHAAILAGLVALRGAASFHALAAPESRAGEPVLEAAREVIQLDVGQGDSALVLMEKGRAGMVDVGTDRALAPSAWMGVLARSGVVRLEWVALTHLDADHAGGLASLLPWVRIGCVVTSDALWKTDAGRALQLELSRWRVRAANWGAPCFPFESFDPGDARTDRPNGAMSGVWIPLPGGRGYAGLGDADREQESRMLPWLLARTAGTRSWIFKVSHHGSKTSSDQKFLSGLAAARPPPSEVWISSGVGNLHGHPSKPVLARLERLRFKIRRTDREGMLRSEAR